MQRFLIMAKIEYYKVKNEGGTRSPIGAYWAYAKIVKHEFFGEETCQTFSFQAPNPKHHFRIGDEFFQGFGFLDTDKYSYYCDLGEPITKEEFDRELKIFMQKLNDFVNTVL